MRKQPIHLPCHILAVNDLRQTISWIELRDKERPWPNKQPQARPGPAGNPSATFLFLAFYDWQSTSQKFSTVPWLRVFTMRNRLPIHNKERKKEKACESKACLMIPTGMMAKRVFSPTGRFFPWRTRAGACHGKFWLPGLTGMWIPGFPTFPTVSWDMPHFHTLSVFLLTTSQ